MAGAGGQPDDAAADAKPHYHDHRKRLRARFLDGDAEAFPDYELLELLLCFAIERVDVKPLAKALIAEFGSLPAVLAADPSRLEAFGRMGERPQALFRAIREASRRMLRAELVQQPVISSWQALLDYCRASLAEERTERFRVLYLDRKNRLIADDLQQRGTVDHAPVYPREVLKRALELGASALILVHNHPSGDPTPSQADVAMTREVRQAADALGITLHDHVVVGRTGTASMRALGLL